MWSEWGEWSDKMLFLGFFFGFCLIVRCCCYEENKDIIMMFLFVI